MQGSKAIPFLTLALSIVALALVLYGSRDQFRPPLEPVLNSREAMLRDMLKHQGRGLDQPVMVRSTGTSKSDQHIENAARRLSAEGFRTVTHFSSDDDPWGPKDTWTLFADTEVVPSPGNLCALRDRVKRLMESESVRYEGWGPPGQP